MKEQIFDFLVTSTGALTLQDILLNFAVASLMAAVIFVSYMVSHSGTSYSPRFNVSLAMLTLVTTLVMSVIGNNIALSLGMVGALSIVRFRTAIKDPRDTAYIFWCIANGICCGVSEFLIAGIGSSVIFLFLLILGFVKNNERYILIIHGTARNSEEVQQVVSQVFNGNAKLRLENSNGINSEIIYEINEKILHSARKNGDIVNYLLKNTNATSVNIVCQNDEINR
ncbi:MAG: DUF4956 domain-containing protein [Lachnospiraceae bacterium]